MMIKKYTIAVHGGAGTLDKKSMTPRLQHEYEDALKQVLHAGTEVLDAGGSSIDAVQAAVVELENSPLFNAGRGSVFNYKGEHSMDAAIMDGSNRKAGAVAGVTSVKNPIRLARMVMDKSDYVLLCSDGALDFARDHQLELEANDYFYTRHRYEEWKKEQATEGHPVNKFGTVGAVALDMAGNLASATSTGGLVNKRYGRVGDTPVIGGGTYANNEACAVSCTGDGEQFIRTVAAYDLFCLMKYKQLPLAEAAQSVMDNLSRIEGSGGLIAVDIHGDIVMPFNSEGMYRASYSSSGVEEIAIF